ncbi:MAG: pseudouridine synthase [Candidatus Jorgensenbacteria bacterium]|nr:pseudouridine synthase [Candidatus Jorgensenbacteria bacterium]
MDKNIRINPFDQLRVDPERSRRINAYLAHKGIASRREADAAISAGTVFINGRRAKLGDRVSPSDKVEVRAKAKEKYYVAYHKPLGIVTHSPRENEQGIADVFHFKATLSPMGRLDKDSHGLMILTNDGRVTARLLDAEEGREKEYFVRVDETVRPGFLNKLSEGITLEGDVRTKPARATRMGEKSFSIVLTEGKRHEIRRMCATFGYRVLELCRTRIMNIRLGTLKIGEGREFTPAERAKFLSALGL